MSHQFEDIAPEGAYLKNLPFASIKKNLLIRAGIR